MNTYTVGELRAALDGIRDDLPVVIVGNKGCHHDAFAVENVTTLCWNKEDMYKVDWCLVELNPEHVPAVGLCMSK